MYPEENNNKCSDFGPEAEEGHYRNGFSHPELLHSKSTVSTSSIDLGFFQAQGGEHEKEQQNRCSLA